MERSEANLRNCIKIINDFAKISGLACNVEKTVVIPIAGNFDPTDTLCNDIKLTWDTQFTILGFDIDNKLEKLDNNLLKVSDKVNRLIHKWKCYELTIIGRVTIAKVLLLSQYTYIATVLNINKDTVDNIQQIINTFVLHNCSYDPLITKKMWMNKEILHGPKQIGGLNLPKVSEFFSSLKVSWIRRYAITKVNDHWADQIDLFFNLTPDTRSDLLLWGSERFNEIVESDTPCITQPVFYNRSIEIARRGEKSGYAKPMDFGLTDSMAKLRICDLYNNLRVINNNIFRERMGEGISIFNRERLTRFIKGLIGHGKRFDCLPTFTPNPPLYTVDSLHKLMLKYPKGSNPYRKLLSIESQGIPPKLHDGTVTIR